MGAGDGDYFFTMNPNLKYIFFFRGWGGGNQNKEPKSFGQL